MIATYVRLARGAARFDGAALLDAVRSGGRYVIALDDGVRLDAGVAALLVAALERGAALAGAAAATDAMSDLGTVYVPVRGRTGWCPEPVRRATATLGDAEFHVDLPAFGAIAVRRADVLASADAVIAAPDAAYALHALSRSAALARRRVVCIARAVVERIARPGDDTVRFPADWIRRSDRATVARAVVRAQGATLEVVPHPSATIVVAGAPEERARALAAVRRTRVPLGQVAWSEDPATAIAAAMRGGDRYVAFVDAARMPADGWLETLVDDLESFAEVSAVIEGGALLIATRGVPAHVRLSPGTAPHAVASMLADALAEAGCSTRDRLAGGLVQAARRRTTPPTLGCVFLATGRPGVVRGALDALLAAMPSLDDLIAVAPGGSDVTRRMLSALPNLRIEYDYVDPLLGAATNRALAAVRTDVVVLASDEARALPGLGAAVVRAATARPDIGAFGIRLGVEDPVHAPPDLTSYADEIDLRRFADARAQRYEGRITAVDRLRLTPIAIDRRALALLGGLLPELGATPAGIEDLSVRLRAAGYGVALVEDAFAHRYAPADSRSLLCAPAQAVSIVRRRYGSNDMEAIIRSGHVGTRDRVAAVPDPGPPQAPRVTLAVAVGDEAEWERAQPVIRRAIEVWTRSDPAALAIGVDGALGVPEIARRVRDALLKADRPLTECLHVYVGRVADGDWSRLAFGDVVVAGASRPALAGRPVLDAPTAGALRALLDEVPA